MSRNDTNRPIRVGIIGTRGIPNTHGGFERFVEVLVASDRWSDGRFRFVVYGEAAAGEHNAWTRREQIPYVKRVNPFLYYAKSAILASRDCDVVLCCGCGIAAFAFWPKLRSRAFLVNPDGCEWRRTKWPWWLRLVVRAVYAPCLLAADRIIVDAEALREDLGALHSAKTTYIGYQAPEPRAMMLSPAVRERLGIHRPFVLVIARLEPENNVRAVLEAFALLRREDVDCLVVGPTTTPHYDADLSAHASEHVRFLGGIFDQELLNELRGGCTAYVHGHSVGGTNPSLLEAISTVGGALICHDNKYNREVAGKEASYFASSADLVPLLARALDAPANRRPVRDPRFHPDEIAARYRAVFLAAGGKRSL